jgi:hypothetical protein
MNGQVRRQAFQGKYLYFKERKLAFNYHNTAKVFQHILAGIVGMPH